MSANANFKPLGQMVEEHAALDEKSTLSTVECLKLLEIRNAERHYTAALEKIENVKYQENDAATAANMCMDIASSVLKKVGE